MEYDQEYITTCMNVKIRTKGTLEYIIEGLEMLEDKYYKENKVGKQDVMYLRNDFQELLKKWKY